MLYSSNPTLVKVHTTSVCVCVCMVHTYVLMLCDMCSIDIRDGVVSAVHVWCVISYSYIVCDACCVFSMCVV